MEKCYDFVDAGAGDVTRREIFVPTFHTGWWRGGFLMWGGVRGRPRWSRGAVAAATQQRMLDR
ncbi:hypothetical protein KC19_3G148600 [Ceratodon purpureus]|uniref:Uncharacterized protein n=1 Tax=Ceratodon purpureus TaxID=3225 RepID=A0A8T0IJZ8_CERPU|nr:hypothetical protein KC19_3G148600 [Ceratodon purpureus]